MSGPPGTEPSEGNPSPTAAAKIAAYKALEVFGRALGNDGAAKDRLAHMQHQIARMYPAVDVALLGPALDMPKGCDCDPSLLEGDRCDGQMMRCRGAIAAWREAK